MGVIFVSVQNEKAWDKETVSLFQAFHIYRTFLSLKKLKKDVLFFFSMGRWLERIGFLFISFSAFSLNMFAVSSPAISFICCNACFKIGFLRPVLWASLPRKWTMPWVNRFSAQA